MVKRVEIEVVAKDSASKTFSKLEKELSDVQKELGITTGKLKNTEEGFSKLTRTADSSTNSFSLLKKQLIAIGALSILKDIGKQVIKLASDLEQNKIAFETMLGSGEAAMKLLSELSTFAANTPFELTGIRQTAKQLLAFGIDSQNLIPTLKSLGDVASGLSVPIDQIARAYGQVRVAGRLMGQDLMQFMNAGVPIIAELAKNMGIAESEVKALVSAGKVGFAEVEKAFQTMSGEGGKFANLMAKQSDTLAGKWSNLQDNLAKVGEELGTTFLPFLSDAVDLFIDLTDTTEVTNDTIRSLESDMDDLNSQFDSGQIDIITYAQEMALLNIKLEEAIEMEEKLRDKIKEVRAEMAKQEEKIKQLTQKMKESSVQTVEGTRSLNGMGSSLDTFGIEMTIAKDTLSVLGKEMESLTTKTTESGVETKKTEEKVKTYGSSASSSIKKVSEAEKELERAQKDQERQAEKTYNTVRKEIEKTLGSIDSLVGKMSDIQTSITDLSSETSFDIASRYVEANSELDLMKTKLTELEIIESERKKTLEDQEIKEDERKKILEEQKTAELEKNKILEQQKSLEEEIALAKGATSQENIDRATMISGESVTERLIREKEEKTVALQEELQLVKDQILEQKFAYMDLIQEKKAMEEEWMGVLEVNNEKQIQMISTAIAKARELNSLMGGGGTQVSSGVNSGTTTSNNTSNIGVNMGGVTVNNGQDANSLAANVANAIKRMTQLYNLGIN